MVKRALILVLGTLAVILLMATVALAASSPQDIYNDFAEDGKLDGSYTDAELRAYLNDSTLDEYSDPSVEEDLDQEVEGTLTRDEFPFTGFQLMIAGILAVALVGGGFVLRRVSRSGQS